MKHFFRLLIIIQILYYLINFVYVIFFIFIFVFVHVRLLFLYSNLSMFHLVIRLLMYFMGILIVFKSYHVEELMFHLDLFLMNLLLIHNLTYGFNNLLFSYLSLKYFNYNHKGIFVIRIIKT